MLEAEWRQVCGEACGMWTKEDESSTGCVWAAGCHHVTTRSRLARIFKLLNLYFFNFPNLFLGRGQPRITEITNNESADTPVYEWESNITALSASDI